MTDNQRLVN